MAKKESLTKVSGHTYRNEDGNPYSLLVDEQGNYWGRRQVNGKRRKRSLGREIEKAVPLLHEFHKIHKSQLSTADGRVKCAVAHKEYLDKGWGLKKELAPSTLDLYRGLWKKYVLKHLGGKRVMDVMPDEIIEVLEDAQESGLEWGGSTLRNLYVAMDAFFEKQTMEPTNRRPDNPVRRIGAENTPPVPTPKDIDDEVVFSTEDVLAMASNFAAPEPPATGRGGHRRFRQSLWVATVMRVLFLLLIESGMRVSEALALTIPDVRYRRDAEVHAVGELPRSIVLTRQRHRKYKATDPNSPLFAELKGNHGKIEGQARRIALPAPIASVLVKYIEEGLESGHLRPGGWLFPNTRQNMFSPGQARKNIVAAAERAGIMRKVTTHHTRHTFVSVRVEKGMDIKEIGSTSGQTDRTITTRYAHRDEESAAYGRMRDAGMLSENML